MDRFPIPPKLRFVAAKRAYDAPALFATDSEEFLQFMCPVLGPSTTLLAHRVTRWMREAGDGFECPAELLAGQFGINVTQLAKSLHRLLMFNMATVPDPETWSIFVDVSHYPVRWLERLPENLRMELVEWQRLVVAGR